MGPLSSFTVGSGTAASSRRCFFIAATDAAADAAAIFRIDSICSGEIALGSATPWAGSPAGPFGTLAVDTTPFAASSPAFSRASFLILACPIT